MIVNVFKMDPQVYNLDLAFVTMGAPDFNFFFSGLLSLTNLVHFSFYYWNYNGRYEKEGLELLSKNKYLKLLQRFKKNKKT